MVRRRGAYAARISAPMAGNQMAVMRCSTVASRSAAVPSGCLQARIAFRAAWQSTVPGLAAVGQRAEALRGQHTVKMLPRIQQPSVARGKVRRELGGCGCGRGAGRLVPREPPGGDAEIAKDGVHLADRTGVPGRPCRPGPRIGGALRGVAEGPRRLRRAAGDEAAVALGSWQSCGCLLNLVPAGVVGVARAGKAGGPGGDDGAGEGQPGRSGRLRRSWGHWTTWPPPRYITTWPGSAGVPSRPAENQQVTGLDLGQRDDGAVLLPLVGGAGDVDAGGGVGGVDQAEQ